MEVVQQIVLPVLAEGQTIDSETAFQPGEARDLAAEGQHRHTPLNTHRAFIDPIGNEVGVTGSFGSLARTSVSVGLQYWL